jgi:chemosensory pili system protein ChpC
MAEEQDSLYTLLVPLVGRRLLVPRACVAEIIGLGRLRLREEGPEWLLGEVGWSERVLPLVSFEAACGDPVPEIGGRSRAVVFRSLTGRLGRGGMAMLCQGLPQLLRVNADVLKAEPPEPGQEGLPVLCRVRMVNETPAIPDLESLEHRIADRAEAAAPD